jgi:hypothetical protein
MFNGNDVSLYDEALEGMSDDLCSHFCQQPEDFLEILVPSSVLKGVCRDLKVEIIRRNEMISEVHESLLILQQELSGLLCKSCRPACITGPMEILSVVDNICENGVNRKKPRLNERTSNMAAVDGFTVDKTVSVSCSISRDCLELAVLGLKRDLEEKDSLIKELQNDTRNLVSKFTPYLSLYKEAVREPSSRAKDCKIQLLEERNRQLETQNRLLESDNRKKDRLIKNRRKRETTDELVGFVRVTECKFRDYPEWSAQSLFMRSPANASTGLCIYCGIIIYVNRLTDLRDHVRDCNSIGTATKQAYFDELPKVSPLLVILPLLVLHF